MLARNPNRKNAHKSKDHSCPMCKPHKMKGGSFFKDKDKALMEEQDIDLPRQITPRIQKGVAGNWGHPRKYIKKHTEIKPYKQRPQAKKKKKKKKPYLWSWHACPFCGEELPDKRKLTITDKFRVWGMPKEEYCECGAIKVKDCPACHRETWFKDEIYKHQRMGCGFVGKRKNK